MKVITLADADELILSPMLETKQLDFDNLPFPNMRASNAVMVFSEDFVDAMTEWWLKWQEATGFNYKAGSAMCESGVKILVGKIHQAVFPWRGVGKVDDEVIARARQEGHNPPTEKFGDFNPGAYDLRCVLPRGVVLNGVTDGGHSTAIIYVHDRAGKCFVKVWEWQNGRWVRYYAAVKDGVLVRDTID